MNVFDEHLQHLRQLKKIPVWLQGHCGAWYPPYREYLQDHGADKKYELTEPLQQLNQATSSGFGLEFYDEIVHPLSAARMLGMQPVCSREGIIGFDELIHSPSQIQQLRVQNMGPDNPNGFEADMQGLMGVIRHVGPFTLTGYLIEGDTPWHPRLRTLLFQYPTYARTLLQKSADAIIQWIHALPTIHQKILFIDEEWSFLLQPEDQDVFVIPWLEYLILKLPQIPILLRAPGLTRDVKRFYKAGLTSYLPEMHANFNEIRQLTAYSMCITTPFDAGRLLSIPPVIRQTVGRFIETHGSEDILITLNSVPLPHTSEAQIQAWIEAIHTFTSV